MAYIRTMSRYVLLVVSMLSLPLCGETLSMGTGFFVSTDGYLATCFHIVSDASQIVVTDSFGTSHSKDCCERRLE